MLVHELIEALLQLPPDLPVMVRAYEDGANDIKTINITGHRICNNPYWFEGKYMITKDGMPCVFLHGDEEEPNI